MFIRLTGGPVLGTELFFLTFAGGLLRKGTSPQQLLESTKDGNSPGPDQQPQEEAAAKVGEWLLPVAL